MKTFPLIPAVASVALLSSFVMPASAQDIFDWRTGALGIPEVNGQKFEFLGLSGTPAKLAQFDTFELMPQSIGNFNLIDAANQGAVISSPGSIVLDYRTEAPAGFVFDQAGGSFNILNNGTGLFQAWTDGINGANLVASTNGPIVDIVPDIYTELFVRNTITLNPTSTLSSVTNAFDLKQVASVPEKGLGIALLGFGAIAGVFALKKKLAN